MESQFLNYEEKPGIFYSMSRTTWSFYLQIYHDLTLHLKIQYWICLNLVFLTLLWKSIEIYLPDSKILKPIVSPKISKILFYTIGSSLSHW